MPAAARAGDKTSHGSAPLGPGWGSAKVKIGGRPAWRAGLDFHNCPLSDGPTKPHVGGVVVIGSSKVLIDGFPAVRQGDKVTELGGGLNEIVEGCSKVQIGG